MAKFFYRMQNILNIKYKLEDQAKQEYSRIRLRLMNEQEKLDCLCIRKEQYFEEYRSLLSNSLNVLEIEQCRASILTMDSFIAEQRKRVAQIEYELEQARIKLNEIMKERKIHEKLKEHQFEEFLQEINDEEKKEIDQLVSYQYNQPFKEE